LRGQNGIVQYTEKITAPKAGTAIPAGGLTRRVEDSVNVTAQGGSTSSAPPPYAYNTLLHAPTRLAFTYYGSGITATWNAVSGSSMYLVKLYDPAATTVRTAFTQGGSATKIVYSASGLTRDITYTGDVSVQVASLSSPPSPRAPFVLVDPPA